MLSKSLKPLKGKIVYSKETPVTYGDDTRRLELHFQNDYGASIIQGSTSYGGSEGLYEIAVLSNVDHAWHITYDTPITEDVIGYLNELEVVAICEKIAELEKKEGNE